MTRPESLHLSAGLACFAGINTAGCAQTFVVLGDSKPRDLPEFTCVNAVSRNLKIIVGGAHKTFLTEYANRHSGEFAYRFNRRFD